MKWANALTPGRGRSPASRSRLDGCRHRRPRGAERGARNARIAGNSLRAPHGAPDCPAALDVSCVCAGQMEDNARYCSNENGSCRSRADAARRRGRPSRRAAALPRQSCECHMASRAGGSPRAVRGPASAYPMFRGPASICFNSPNDIVVPRFVSGGFSGSGSARAACPAPRTPSRAPASVMAAVPNQRRQS